MRAGSSKSTWGGGRPLRRRHLDAPAIDPELGMIYFNAAIRRPITMARPSGINLFTNSIVALHLATGKLAWHYQAIHHDLWDSDLASGPVLFDMKAGGKTIKGIGSLGKHCFAYILNRETGRPINPIVETAVPTRQISRGRSPGRPSRFRSRRSERPSSRSVRSIRSWQTQSTRHARAATVPSVHDERTRGISSPGVTGGATWGSSSFSPRTGFLYVTGKNQAASLRVKVVGDTLNPGPNAPGFRESFLDPDHSALEVSQTVTAYDARSGVQVWRRGVSQGPQMPAMW